MCKTLIRSMFTLAVMTSVCIPQTLLAEQQAAPTPISTDVILSNGNVLRGAIVTPEGQPVAGVRVDVRSDQKIIASVRSDNNGQYVV